MTSSFGSGGSFVISRVSICSSPPTTSSLCGSFLLARAAAPYTVRDVYDRLIMGFNLHLRFNHHFMAQNLQALEFFQKFINTKTRQHSTLVLNVVAHTHISNQLR
jgi:hypothetical protein